MKNKIKKVVIKWIKEIGINNYTPSGHYYKQKTLFQIHWKTNVCDL
jgi:hypothetical protein